MDEAIAITKQKIYDLAQIAYQEKLEAYEMGKQISKRNHVLAILCGDDHIITVGNNSYDRGTARNEVLDMIKNELELDIFYLHNNKVILIRIDQDTINNPVLSEW